MKTSTKAALLAALFFPGLGHLVVKSYWRAALLVTTSFIALYLMMAVASERAVTVVDQIYSGQGPADMAALSDTVASSSTGSDDSMATAAMLVLLACWLIGIFDSYRLGKLVDQKDS